MKAWPGGPRRHKRGSKSNRLMFGPAPSADFLHRGNLQLSGSLRGFTNTHTHAAEQEHKLSLKMKVAVAGNNKVGGRGPRGGKGGQGRQHDGKKFRVQ
eukprot:scaffold158937_cov13-Tisochrysis_lutea.AAC.1